MPLLSHFIAGCLLVLVVLTAAHAVQVARGLRTLSEQDASVDARLFSYVRGGAL